MKNFIFGVLAGLILFVGFNNKSTVASVTVNIIKKTGVAFNNAFNPKMSNVQESPELQVVEKQTVKMTQTVAKVAQKVSSKVINVAQAETLPVKYIAPISNNSISQNVSQYKIKRQNTRTSISLISE